MNLVERGFLVTDFLFPAKTPRSERKKLFFDLGNLSPNLRRVVLIGEGGYLDASELLPKEAHFVSEAGEADALLLDTSPEEAVSFLEKTLIFPPLFGVPVAFQLSYDRRPFYSALLRFAESRRYSLFNLYNVRRNHGQIRTAYALFLNPDLRERYVHKISA